MKILFFSPFQDISAHAIPEVLLAKGLSSKNEIIYITCNGLYRNYCVSMSAVCLKEDSSDEDKNKVCIRCKQKKSTLIKVNIFKFYDLENFLTDEITSEVNNKIAKINKENFFDFVIDNFEIGRIASYEFLINYKIRNYNFSDEKWEKYKISLINTLYTYFLSKEIIGKEKPESILNYNTLYSVNNMFKQVAESFGISVYFMHAGDNFYDRLSRLSVAKKTTYDNSRYVNEWWKIYKNIPSTKEMIIDVTNHFIELIKGQSIFTYSTPKNINDRIDIRNYFNIKKEQKILIATMSSLDERFAAEAIGVVNRYTNLIFKDQIDWIKELIHWIKDHNNYFLIIRPHPREFPNKRESLKSESAIMLENALTNLPENVKVNWPNDNISIYDLAEEVDVFLNSWSSAGFEMSLFGIPVVIYSKELLTQDPYDLNYLANDKEDYFKKIDEAMRDGYSFEKVIKTYRWYSLKFFRSVINIVSKSKEQNNSIVIKLINKVIIKLSKTKNIYNTDNEIVNELKTKYISDNDVTLINKMINESKNSILDVIGNDILDVNKDEEVKFIKEEIKRLFTTMYGNASSNNNGKLFNILCSIIQNEN